VVADARGSSLGGLHAARAAAIFIAEFVSSARMEPFLYRPVHARDFHNG
jgi:hypothetical protein